MLGYPTQRRMPTSVEQRNWALVESLAAVGGSCGSTKRQVGARLWSAGRSEAHPGPTAKRGVRGGVGSLRVIWPPIAKRQPNGGGLP